jgi:hypothetical protein
MGFVCGIPRSGLGRVDLWGGGGWTGGGGVDWWGGCNAGSAYSPSIIRLLPHVWHPVFILLASQTINDLWRFYACTSRLVKKYSTYVLCTLRTDVVGSLKSEVKCIFLKHSGVTQGLFLFRKFKKLCLLHTYNTWFLHLCHPHVILSILKRESP